MAFRQFGQFNVLECDGCGEMSKANVGDTTRRRFVSTIGWKTTHVAGHPITDWCPACEILMHLYCESLGQCVSWHFGSGGSFVLILLQDGNARWSRLDGSGGVRLLCGVHNGL